MVWIPVFISDSSKLIVPDVCPNCMRSPATTQIRAYSTVGLPGVAHATYELTWPHCESCAQFNSRPQRLQNRMAMIPAGILLAAAVVCAVFKIGQEGVFSEWALRLVGLAVVFVITGSVFAPLIHGFSRLPDGCNFRFYNKR